MIIKGNNITIDIIKGENRALNVTKGGHLSHYIIPEPEVSSLDGSLISGYLPMDSLYIGAWYGLVLSNYIPKMGDWWEIDCSFEYGNETQLYHADNLQNPYTYWGSSFTFIDGSSQPLPGRVTGRFKNNSSGDSTVTLGMFGGFWGAKNNYYMQTSNGRFYYLTVYDKNGKLKHNFRPVYNTKSDSGKGMFGILDTVEQVYCDVTGDLENDYYYAHNYGAEYYICSSVSFNTFGKDINHTLCLYDPYNRTYFKGNVKKAQRDMENSSGYVLDLSQSYKTNIPDIINNNYTDNDVFNIENIKDCIEIKKKTIT